MKHNNEVKVCIICEDVAVTPQDPTERYCEECYERHKDDE